MFRKILLTVMAAIFLHGSAIVAHAQKLYLFSEGDVHDSKVGVVVTNGTQSVREFFSSVMPGSRLEIYNSNGSWNGPNISRSYDVKNDILTAIRNCPAGSSDTIVFYWCGHGAFDEGGHFLWMPQNRGDRAMYRSEILRALKAKNVSLVVLMTESCNVYQVSPMSGKAPAWDEPESENVPPIIRSLFFNYSGVVDFNTSSVGQTAKADNDGGFFTQRFIDYLYAHTNKESNWKTVLDSINSELRRDGLAQNSYVWTLPAGREHNKIERTNQWSDAKFHPESGDRILFVNDIEIQNETHFRRVIREAETRVVLTLVDRRSGNRYYMMTDLNSKNSSDRLGIYVQSDSRGGVSVTRITPGSPGTKCRYLINGDVESVRSSVDVY